MKITDAYSMGAKQTLLHHLGYQFKTESLLTQALTHTSVSKKGSYERLEFLGDRILGAVVADLIYHHDPDESEGHMAKRFARLVRSETLAQVALAVGIDKAIIMAKGEQTSGGRHKKSILADVCESVIAALYLDGGMEVAAAFITQHWTPLLSQMESIPVDPKTHLQELSQAKKLGVPHYVHTGSRGPDHAPTFFVEVHLKGFPPQKGEGPSKRIAEQKAAQLLLDLFRNTL